MARMNRAQPRPHLIPDWILWVAIVSVVSLTVLTILSNPVSIDFGPVLKKDDGSVPAPSPTPIPTAIPTATPTPPTRTPTATPTPSPVVYSTNAVVEFKLSEAQLPYFPSGTWGGGVNGDDYGTKTDQARRLVPELRDGHFFQIFAFHQEPVHPEIVFGHLEYAKIPGGRTIPEEGSVLPLTVRNLLSMDGGKTWKEFRAEESDGKILAPLMAIFVRKNEDGTVTLFVHRPNQRFWFEATINPGDL